MKTALTLVASTTDVDIDARTMLEKRLQSVIQELQALSLQQEQNYQLALQEQAMQDTRKRLREMMLLVTDLLARSRALAQIPSVC